MSSTLPHRFTSPPKSFRSYKKGTGKAGIKDTGPLVECNKYQTNKGLSLFTFTTKCSGGSITPAQEKILD